MLESLQHLPCVSLCGKGGNFPGASFFLDQGLGEPRSSSEFLVHAKRARGTLIWPTSPERRKGDDWRCSRPQQPANQESSTALSRSLGGTWGLGGQTRCPHKIGNRELLSGRPAPSIKLEQINASCLPVGLQPCLTGPERTPLWCFHTKNR